MKPIPQAILNVVQSCLFPDITATAERVYRAETLRLYEDVRAEFKKMAAVKKNGHQLYTTQYIISELAMKFYRSQKTIENILYGRV